jgi:hypothetical protein
MANTNSASIITSKSGGGGVTSLNTLTGAVTLSAGTNITLTPSGNNVAIAASGGSTTITAPFFPPWMNDAAITATKGPGANAIGICPVSIPYPQLVTNMTMVTQSGGTGVIDIGIYSLAGTLLGHWNGLTNPAGQVYTKALSGGAITLQPGVYLFAYGTSAAITIACAQLGTVWTPCLCYTTSTTPTSGILPSSISVSATMSTGYDTNPMNLWGFILT